MILLDCMILMQDSLKILSNIKYLVIHCSDNEFKLENAKDIHNLHLNFGWEGIGYHKVIKRDGKIENGRPEYWMGAHVFGHNKNSLGLCLIGTSYFTKKQIISLKIQLIKWKRKYPYAEILGHRDFKNTKKTCPNFDVKNWCKKENLI